MINQSITERDWAKEYTARLETLCVSGAIDRQMLESMRDAKLITDMTLDRLILTLVKRLAAVEFVEPPETTKETDEVQWPTTWFQHLKFDLAHRGWVPLWFQHRWPARMQVTPITKRVTTIHKTVKMCPHVMVPDQSRHLRWLTQEDLVDAGPVDGEDARPTRKKKRA